MTTTEHSTTVTAAPSKTSFDTGPLSWVMVEIREALARSRTALLEAGGRAPEDQATQLQLAKTHLHQAHGALQMVDVDGVGRITELAETALDHFKSGAVKCSTDNVEMVTQLYQALVAYLEELLAGAPSQPARLYPYYRAVLQMTGAERIHPADLFFPDLDRVAALAPADRQDVTVPDYAACRQRFERALLPYLKSLEPAQQQEHAAVLQEAVAAVAACQVDANARAFWLATRLTASGASVYALSEGGATSATARYMAQRENGVDLLGATRLLNLKDKDPMLAGVILDMSMNATIAASLQLGNTILGSLSGITSLHQKRVEQAGFAVLKSPDIPSILVETGFMSNPRDSERLITARHQQAVADGLFNGLIAYFQKNPPANSHMAWVNEQKNSTFVTSGLS